MSSERRYDDGDTCPGSERRMSPKAWYEPSALESSELTSIPVQRLISLNWIRSRSTPPNTMAPSRPLPIGSASVIHDFAGRSYQSSMDALPLATVEAGDGLTSASAWNGPA